MNTNTTPSTIGAQVKYQYSKNWLRFGEVIEFDAINMKSRVLWNREVYCGNGGIPDRTLKVRTWVRFGVLSIA